MSLERTWLLGTARAEREALGRTIQYMPNEAWEAPSASEGWRNRDIVAHLASGEVAAAAVMGGETSAEIEEFVKSLGNGPMSVDAFNDFAVRRRAEGSFRSVVGEWGKAADLFLARASSGPPEDWDGRRVPWVNGQMRISYMVQSRVMEWWLHGEDLRAGGELPARLEHPPIYCVNELAVRLIPYSLGLAGLSYPGRSVRIELEAVGGGSWHYGLAPRETPDPKRKPDCVIEGRGYPFALAAGRRAPADYYLSEGVLQIGGDEDIGEAVLANLRAFA